MKKALIVSFYLDTPAKNLAYIEKGVKALGQWVHVGANAFVIFSDQSPATIRDKLSFVLENEDKIFITEIMAPAAWWGFPDLTTKQLQKMFRGDHV